MKDWVYTVQVIAKKAIHGRMETGADFKKRKNFGYKRTPGNMKNSEES